MYDWTKQATESKPKFKSLNKNATIKCNVACIVMKRKLKKCSFILEQKLTEIQYLASLLMVNYWRSILFQTFGSCYLFRLILACTCNVHVAKVSKRIFFIYNLARAGICESDFTQVYISIIQPVLEYACPVWHPGLSKAQSSEIERIQKRCLRIIYQECTYTETFLISGLDTL